MIESQLIDMAVTGALNEASSDYLVRVSRAQNVLHDLHRWLSREDPAAKGEIWFVSDHEFWLFTDEMAKTAVDKHKKRLVSDLEKWLADSDKDAKDKSISAEDRSASKVDAKKIRKALALVKGL